MHNRINSTEKAALILQRAWRKRQFLKSQSHQPNVFTETSLRAFLGDKLYAECQQLNITANPPLTIEDNRVNVAQAQTWIDAHSTEVKPVATMVIKYLKRVSLEKFLHRLRVTINEFNKVIMQLPENERQFIIILGESDDLNSSNAWILSLALPHLARPPVAIVPVGRHGIWGDQMLATLSEHTRVKKLLCIDDAIYSGKQITENLMHALITYNESVELLNLIRARSLTVYIAAPYILLYEDFYKYINKLVLRSPKIPVPYKLPIVVLPHMPMLILEKLLNAEERSVFSQLHPAIKFYSGLERRSLTFFAQKVADRVSVPACLVEGYKLVEDEATIPFVPKTIPPYRR